MDRVGDEAQDMALDDWPERICAAADGRAMSVDYALSPDDMAALNAAVQARDWPFRVVLWIVGLALGAAVAWLLIAGQSGNAARLGIILAAWIAIPGRVRKLGNAGLKKVPPSQYEPRRLTLSPAGVTVTIGEREETLPWTRFRAIVTTDQHLFLFIAKRHAHIVPRRAFADEASFSAYADYARSFVRTR